MPRTKRGIYHNLKESKYVVSNSEITYFFSSELYRDKFLAEYKQHREHFTAKIMKLTGETPLNMETLADITLYEMIEKRGFHAWLKGVDISCQEMYKYALRKMIDKNTLDWYETQKPKLGERIKTME